MIFLRIDTQQRGSLNLELKNITETAASKAKIFWFDPDRKVVFDEERLVSIPAGETLSIAASHTFSAIPDNKLGIWHVDYVLNYQEGKEIQGSRRQIKAWKWI